MTRYQVTLEMDSGTSEAVVLEKSGPLATPDLFDVDLLTSEFWSPGDGDVLRFKELEAEDEVTCRNCGAAYRMIPGAGKQHAGGLELVSRSEEHYCSEA